MDINELEDWEIEESERSHQEWLDTRDKTPWTEEMKRDAKLYDEERTRECRAENMARQCEDRMIQIKKPTLITDHDRVSWVVRNLAVTRDVIDERIIEEHHKFISENAKD